MIDIDRVSSDDLMSLATDRGIKPMQVGAILLLDTSDGGETARIIASIERRLPSIPRLRQRLVTPAAIFGRPFWVDEPNFRIDNHVRTELNPLPGGLNGLLALGSTLVSTRLPIDRPLWDALIVPDVDEDRTGLVIVFHHVMADGVAGLTILEALADSHPAPPKPDFPRPGPTRTQLFFDCARSHVRGVRRLPQALTRLRMGLRQLAPSMSKRAPKSSLNQPTASGQLLTVVRCDLADLRDVAHANQATINDVVLTAVAGALHGLLLHRGELVNELVISVPFSSRARTTGGSLGNQNGPIPIRLPATGSAHDRLRSVAARTAAAKTSARGTSSAILGPLFRMLARVGMYQRFVDHQRLVNTFVTNLKGPAVSLSLGGLPILDVVPLIVAGGNVTASFAVLSYAGTLSITIVSDPTACADIDVLRTQLAMQLAAFTSGA